MAKENELKLSKQAENQQKAYVDDLLKKHANKETNAFENYILSVLQGTEFMDEDQEEEYNDNLEEYSDEELSEIADQEEELLNNPEELDQEEQAEEQVLENEQPEQEDHQEEGQEPQAAQGVSQEDLQSLLSHLQGMRQEQQQRPDFLNNPQQAQAVQYPQSIQALQELMGQQQPQQAQEAQQETQQQEEEQPQVRAEHFREYDLPDEEDAIEQEPNVTEQQEQAAEEEQPNVIADNFREEDLPEDEQEADNEEGQEEEPNITVDNVRHYDDILEAINANKPDQARKLINDARERHLQQVKNGPKSGGKQARLKQEQNQQKEQRAQPNAKQAQQQANKPVLKGKILTPAEQQARRNAQFTPKQLKQQAKVHQQAQARKQQQANNTGKPGWFKPGQDQVKKYSLLTPEQEKNASQINKLIGSSLGNLNLPGSQQNSFGPIANENIRRFEQQGIPTIAERFGSLGGAGTEGGALSSPDLYKQLFSNSQDFYSQLAAQQAQYGLQNSAQQGNNLSNLLQAGLGKQFDYDVTPGQPSKARQLWNGVGQPLLNTGVQAGLGYLGGGPIGAAAGVASGLGGFGNANYNQGNNMNGQGFGASGFAQNNNPLMPNMGSGFQGGQNNIMNSIVQGYANQF